MDPDRLDRHEQFINQLSNIIWSYEWDLKAAERDRIATQIKQCRLLAPVPEVEKFILDIVRDRQGD